MIDSIFSLGCCAVSFVPLVAFWVPVMTPAEPPQGRRRPKIRPHFGHFECSGRPREVEWAGPRPCTSLHMSPRWLHAWPEGAVVAAVMAPAEGKNGKSGFFFSRRARLPGHIWDFHIIKFEFFSETLRAVCPESFRGNGQF